MPASSFRCAVVQVCSTEDVEQNVDTAMRLVGKAADDGAEVIALPENFSWLRLEESHPTASTPLDGYAVKAMAELARNRGVELLLGSIPEAGGPDGKSYNTSVWIDANGSIAATYRKIHLFDIDLKGRESHQESKNIEPGEQTVVLERPQANFGLSICYDLRFPRLYRHLVAKGAEVLTVPSAFTLTTGKDHWTVLLRARAIENQCFVLAPNQWGHHGGKRRSYGRSAIIDPWGVVLAEVPDGEGYAVARLNRADLERTRNQLPCLQHQRPDLL